MAEQNELRDCEITLGMAAAPPRARAEAARRVERFAAEQSLKQELASAKTQLAGRKDVERAKGLLMKQKKIDEEEAFRQLRKFAMDQGIKMAEAATRVIDMAKLMG